MPDSTRRREAGRGERVLPGLWRLRLPLPWPGIPHCNAWAIAAGDGIVLVDCGIHEPGSLAQLERALDQVNLRLESVRLLCCTHGHSDHYGQAAAVVERAGCELWMHPNHAHALQAAGDPEQRLARRMEISLQSGVPEKLLREWLAKRSNDPSGFGPPVEPDRPLVEGVEVQTDLGAWRVIETPGHAPSHICLHQPERRLLISGDHLLGRISLYFEYGFSPDPVGEFLASLDKVQALDARLCLSGHGKPFTDVRAHIDANRALVAERLDAVMAGLADGPRTAYDLVRQVRPDGIDTDSATWFISQILAYLTHLETIGRARREPGSEPERWAAS